MTSSAAKRTYVYLAISRVSIKKNNLLDEVYVFCGLYKSA